MKELGIILYNNERKSFFKKSFWKKIFKYSFLTEYEASHGVVGETFKFYTIVVSICDYNGNIQDDRNYLEMNLMAAMELLKKKGISLVVLDKFLLDFEERFQIIKNSKFNTEIITGEAVKAYLIYNYLKSLYKFAGRSMGEEEVIFMGDLDFYAYRLFDLLANNFNYIMLMTDDFVNAKRLTEQMYVDHGLSIGVIDIDKFDKYSLRNYGLILNNSSVLIEARSLKKDCMLYLMSRDAVLDDKYYEGKVTAFDDILIRNDNISEINPLYNNPVGYGCCIIECMLRLAGYNFDMLYSQNTIRIKELKGLDDLFLKLGFKIRGLTRNGYIIEMSAFKGS